MRHAFVVVIILLVLAAQFGCSGHRAVSKENPEAGASAKIVMLNGKIHEGLLLVVEGDTLKYIDAKSHQPEVILLSTVKEIKPSDFIYDLEGNTITDADIRAAKSSQKTITYAAGGTVLGAAVGLGIGLFLANNYDVPTLYPIAAMGITGGILFGLKGNATAYEDAIETVREERYQAMQIKMRQDLEEQRKRLEEERDREEQKLKELKEKQK
jgi:hypothetical protein